MNRPIITLAILAAGIGLLSRPAIGQERVSAVVEYIAGTNIYLGVGTEAGVGVNDTLVVYADGGAEPLGALVVIGSSQGRSMATFAGDPFPVTRGRVLDIALNPSFESRSEAIPESAPASATRQLRSPTSASVSPRASGRLSVDVNMIESTTKLGDDETANIDRRFTTPAIRLRMAIAQLPGGLTFNTNFRAASRFTSADAIEPRQSFRIYQASLEKSFESYPIQMQVGRFYNPFESFSGYWDGLLVHFGEEGFGIGGAVGFQPYLSNEDFSTDVPKYTAFLNYRKSSGAVRYYADLSGHMLQPRSGLPQRTYLGLSQRFYWHRLQLSQRLQVDRHPIDEKWVITQLDVRSSIPIGGQLSLVGQYSMRRPFIISRPDDPIAAKSERASAGFTYYLFSGTFGADLTANRWDDSDVSFTYGSHFSFPRTPLLGLGFRAAGSYWKREDITTLYISPGIQRSFGRLQSELSYQRYVTERASQSNVSDALELFVTFPIGRRLYYTLQGRTQWGDTLESNSLYTGFWVSF
jgi:hypothetical protein